MRLSAVPPSEQNFGRLSDLDFQKLALVAELFYLGGQKVDTVLDENNVFHIDFVVQQIDWELVDDEGLVALDLVVVVARTRLARFAQLHSRVRLRGQNFNHRLRTRAALHRQN